MENTNKLGIHTAATNLYDAYLNPLAPSTISYSFVAFFLIHPFVLLWKMTQPSTIHQRFVAKPSELGIVAVGFNGGQVSKKAPRNTKSHSPFSSLTLT